MTRRRPARFWDILGTLIGIGLGGMLLLAALSKAADPSLFVEQIRSYKILPAMAGFGAYAFIWIEIILGSLLLLAILPKPALAGTFALLLLFIGVTAWSMAHGNTSGCGCFGRLASRPPKEVIEEDGVYAVLAAAAFFLSPWIRLSRGRWIAYGLALPVLLASPWVAPLLPIDSWVTPIHRGADLENLAADDLKYPLSDGKLFVAFLGDDCASCVKALPMMEALGKEEGAPRMTGIFAGDRARKRAWALRNVPSFPLAHSPEKALRQYYRKLPVFVLLEQGKVRRVWWNRIPDPAEVLRAGG